MLALSKGAQQKAKIHWGIRSTEALRPIDDGELAGSGLGLSYADGIYEAGPEVDWLVAEPVSGPAEESQDPVEPESRVNRPFVCCLVQYQVLSIRQLRNRSGGLICCWRREFAVGFILGG